MTQPIALPTIHLNGTGAKTLRDEYHALRMAVDAAQSRLQDATCNGRDFYPQGPEAFQQAQADRREMFRLLEVVYDYALQWEIKAMQHLPNG